MLHTIFYHNELRRTTTQLTIIVVLTGFVTNQFDVDPSPRTWKEIINFRNPLLNDRPLYRVFEQILETYQASERSTQSDTGVAPLVPVYIPVEPTRLDT